VDAAGRGDRTVGTQTRNGGCRYRRWHGVFRVALCRCCRPCRGSVGCRRSARNAQDAEERAPGNIRLLEGDASHTGLPDGTCDLAFLANIWHELDGQCAILAEMRRILRAGGRLAILDRRSDVPYPPGPPPDHRVAAGEAEATLRGADWRNVAFGLLGPYSYLLIASAQ